MNIFGRYSESAFYHSLDWIVTPENGVTKFSDSFMKINDHLNKYKKLEHMKL